MRRLFILFFSSLVMSCGTSQKWSRVQTPTLEPARSIGGYSAGCVAGAISLTPDGEGYQVMRLGRNRFYGHPSLIAFLERFSRELQKRKIGPLLIGDLSQPRGGPMEGGHLSHQTGLDADLWYWSPDNERSLPLHERALLSAPVILNAENEVVNTDFGYRLLPLLQVVASDSAVDRVFVNFGIKKELCRRFPSDVWHLKVRAWWGHDDHFHVRLKCPIDSPECLTQAPPLSNGCDEIDWWFTPAAQRPQEARPQTVELPASCDPVLSPQ